MRPALLVFASVTGVAGVADRGHSGDDDEMTQPKSVPGSVPREIDVRTATAPPDVAARLTQLVDGKVPIGAESFLGFPPTLDGFAGERFYLRVDRQLPGVRAGYNSFRVAGVGQIIPEEEGTHVSGTIDLIGRRALGGFRVLIFGLLVVAGLLGIAIVLANPMDDDLGSLVVVVGGTLGFAAVVEWFWRRALRMAASDAAVLSDAIERAAQGR